MRLIAAVMLAGLAGSAARRPAVGRSQTAAALADIVGVWQSDTTNGSSAISSCDWTPRRGAVLCEQDVSTPGGHLHALNMFTVNPAGGYTFYVVTRPGDVIRPVPLAIHDHIWIYGGGAPEADGKTYRTVNDFTGTGSYTWRQESSSDGTRWTAGAHGRSIRVTR